MAMSSAMIATTTSTSISVKPCPPERRDARSSGRGGPFVLLLQDVHDEKTAQRNIGACLAAGHDLALMGFRPTIFEMDPQPAGMLYTGVPGYRLPRELIRAEVAVRGRGD